MSTSGGVARIRWDLAAAALGMTSLLWGSATLALEGLPAWPAVSVGVLACWLSRRPGQPLARGLATFAGLLGSLLGLLEILGAWMVLHVISS